MSEAAGRRWAATARRTGTRHSEAGATGAAPSGRTTRQETRGTVAPATGRLVTAVTDTAGTAVTRPTGRTTLSPGGSAAGCAVMAHAAAPATRSTGGDQAAIMATMISVTRATAAGPAATNRMTRAATPTLAATAAIPIAAAGLLTEPAPG